MLTMVKIAASREAWKYVSDGVADDAGMRRGASASYYITGGNPAGVWYGSGLADVGLTAGDNVDVAQLERLIGNGQNPLTGEQLGRAMTVATPLDTRVAARLAALPADLAPADRDVAHEAILTEEGARTVRGSVSGFELVFSPPKSVSTWWALADPKLKDEIRAAHHAAIKTTIDVLERDVARTRIGVDGIAQTGVRGILATGFDHWESREGDPQLHTHLLVSNRVMGEDGKWRTLDSRHGLSPAVVTLSEQYNASLMDELSMRLGVEWTVQEVSADPAGYAQWRKTQGWADSAAARSAFALEQGVERRNQKWEIAGIPDRLNRAFSQRSEQVRASKEALIQAWTEQHGKPPSRTTVFRMRAAAAIRSRQKKSAQPLRALTASWRDRAEPVVGDTWRFAERLHREGMRRLKSAARWSNRGDDITDRHIEQARDAVLSDLTTERSTFTRFNVEAAAHRVMKVWRLRSPEDRDQALARITQAVLTSAVTLTPKSALSVPWQFQAADGTSQFAPAIRDLYTTAEVVAAEERLLTASNELTDLTIDRSVVAAAVDATDERGLRLSDDQADAVTSIATSGRRLDVLVGPAGAGKTTTLQKLRAAWEAEHGSGSVRGLAPTARAAEELSESLGIPTENTAKWLHETTKKDLHSADFQMKRGDLVIVDEASIAGTLALDGLREQAERHGAKLLLVGDWAQLAAVDAGGAFGLIARSRDDAPELHELHRFKSQWEAAASTMLRLGRHSALESYIDNDRIDWGLAEGLIHQVVDAWRADEAAGHKSLLIAPTNALATQLNDVARAWRISTGQIDASLEVAIATGRASVGDRIVTRQNDRKTLTDAGNWVRNNAEWIIESIEDGGAVRARANNGEVVLLSSGYVADHVQLAYACTAHRSQGRTVDTSHAIVDGSTGREAFYVAMTRGRSSNRAYVAVDPSEQMEGMPGQSVIERSWRDVLTGILDNSGAELSALETATAEADRINSIRQLAAEYDTIAQAGHEARHTATLIGAGLNVDTITAERSWPNLRRALEQLEQPQDTLVTALNSGPLPDGELSGALAFRLARLGHEQHTAADSVRILGGLRQTRTGDTALDVALVDREQAIALRAEILVDAALENNAPWLTQLPPRQVGREQHWRTLAAHVAAYRDRWGVESDAPLGNDDGATRLQREARQHVEALLSSREPAVTQPAIEPYPAASLSQQERGSDRPIARSL